MDRDELMTTLGRIEAKLDSLLPATVQLEARVSHLENLKFKLMGGAAVLATFTTAFITLIVASIAGWLKNGR